MSSPLPNSLPANYQPQSGQPWRVEVEDDGMEVSSNASETSLEDEDDGRDGYTAPDTRSLNESLVDSTYETDSANSGEYYESVGSSAFEYPVENGRTYHAYQEGKYLMPNDEREQDRMDLAYHSINKMFDDTLFFAPVSHPQRIADMGTGTGIWAMAVGDLHPSAQVIGIDLSPIQPRWVPPNVQFRIDDIDRDWIFESPFDLIHSRICSGVAIRSWPKYLSSAFSCLKPGGWVEAQEFDMAIHDPENTLPENSWIKSWREEVEKAFRKAGCEMRISGEELAGHMREAGFVNVTVKEFKWPMTPWMEEERLKEAGAFAMLSMLEDLEGLSLGALTRYGGWKASELEVFLERVRKEWRLKGLKTYWPLYVVYGQKPEVVRREEDVWQLEE